MNATVIRTKRISNSGSACLRGLVWSAAALTVGLLAAMIVNLMVKGLPHLKSSLFAWTYTSENVSLLPAADADRAPRGGPDRHRRGRLPR